jgi:hypothetical protein
VAAKQLVSPVDQVNAHTPTVPNLAAAVEPHAREANRRHNRYNA